MSYTVQELAEMAGVSVRTLHHYDDIDLLNPSRAENGYRSYDEEDLLRLQQILLYREMEFPLDDIRAILDDPAFDTASALREHRTRITQKRERLKHLISTVDATLRKLSGEDDLEHEKLFDAFWEKHEKEYAKEAEERWGHTDAYQQSKERTKHLKKEDYARMAKEGDVFMRSLTECMAEGPASAAVQAKIAQHYESLRTFYDPSPELYRGLGTMYCEDPRFRAYYEKYDPAMPEFMREAMGVFCDGLEKNE